MEPAVLETIRNEWRNAGRGMKTGIIQRWSEVSGYSYASLYRMMQAGRVRRSCGPKIPDLDMQVSLIAAIKRRPPEHRGEITTEDAIQIASDSGHQITASKSTIDRKMREMGLCQRQRRVIRYQAEYPNQLHHVDASSSNCFYAAGETGDGDYILKLHRGMKGYKNKPVPIRKRPWIYGLVDDYSGYSVMRYIVTEGESMADNLDFLSWAWSQTPEKEFFGLPDFLKGDHGPMMKSDEANFFFQRLGVAIDPSTPENKEAHGKIERPWRTLWERFELPFYAEDMKTFEIRLSELNTRLMYYLAAYNQKKHRYQKKYTRKQVWLSINHRGGAVALPENAIRHIVKRYERTLDSAGVFTIDSEAYEVKGLHSAKIWVYLGVFDGVPVVQDKATGEKYEAVKFVPKPFGEFAGVAHTPHQKAVAAAQELQLSNTLHTEKPVQESGNVVAFPAKPKVREIRQIQDVTDLTRYRNADEAMADFIGMAGFVPDSEMRMELAGLFAENGLARWFVQEMASEVTRQAACG